MLTFDYIRGIGVLRMLTSATFLKIMHFWVFEIFRKYLFLKKKNVIQTKI